ncbi:MAG TPA: beta-N-acetylglucosaminidase domain-containing protein [Myxococcota bacterium]|nr:beta-N-acetylglucosaminidase domain-containing protein [Myxococcota bacterium]HOH76042.1 beta-N-acetylglucosaminidase domain-containing protein [Myxococcota bacterium]HPV03928.1 beta-N-acetylglucosaminidase domain-containing protein [Myxococcota bacterium]
MRSRTTLAAAFLAACAMVAGCGDEPVKPVMADIVPHVRIAASDTLHEAFPWPIEAQDGPATIRDGNPGTSWKVPAGQTVLTLDIQPWLQRPVELGSLSIQASGGVDSVSVALMGACGSTATVVEWPDISVALDLSGREAGCVELTLTASENAAVSSLTLVAMVPAAAVAAPAPAPVDVRVSDRPWSGVIEGFYGVPWSWEERRRMVDLLSRTGMGSYIYCPKWDPFHRAEWRDQYPETDLELFGELISYAADREVAFSFGISPFIDFDTTTDDDYQILKSKIEAFILRGATSVTLLADDIEFETAHPIGGEMGQAHAAVVNRLLDDLRRINPDVVMAFCPTVYSDERIESLGEASGDGAAYLSALSALDSDVQILWTGPHTSDAVMTAADMDNFRSFSGRKPVIWDNFWANDGGDGFLGRTMLSTYTGREPALADAVTGIMHNPSIQGGLSRLTMGTFADFMRNPDGYDPDAAIDFSAGLEATSGASFDSDSERSRELVRYLMSLFDGNAQLMPGSRPVARLADSLANSLKEGGDGWLGDALELAPHLARMVVAWSEVHHSDLAPDIVDELYYPLEKARLEGETGLLVLKALLQKASGGNAAAYLEQAAVSMYESNSCRFTFGEGEIEDLLEAASKAVVKVGTGRLVEVAFDVPPCTAGSEWSVPVSAMDSSVSVFGLPGATVREGAIGWLPPHAGMFAGVVIAVAADGLGFMEFEVVCEDPGRGKE